MASRNRGRESARRIAGGHGQARQWKSVPVRGNPLCKIGIVRRGGRMCGILHRARAKISSPRRCNRCRSRVANGAQKVAQANTRQIQHPAHAQLVKPLEPQPQRRSAAPAPQNSSPPAIVKLAALAPSACGGLLRPSCPRARRKRARLTSAVRVAFGFRFSDFRFQISNLLDIRHYRYCWHC